MKSFFENVFIVVYAVIAITVTILLLSYNEYNCSEIGGKTFYIVQDNSLQPDYQKGDLLIIQHASDREIFEDDRIFLYKVLSREEYEVVVDKLESKIQQGSHISYELESYGKFDSSYLIGKESDVIVVHKLGTILAFLQSQWGYLFCIVIVSLLLFLQEVFELVVELKYGSEKDKEEGKTKVKEE